MRFVATFVIALITGLTLCEAQQSTTEYQGVSNAELQMSDGTPKNGSAARIIEMGDRLIVELSNLDGWLYETAKAGNFPKQEWFDPDAMKLISTMDLKTLQTAAVMQSADAQHAVAQRAWESVQRMMSDVKQRLYLQLGPARLRHLHADDPLIRQSDTGIFRFVFVIHDTPDDQAEWKKLRATRGELRPVSISVAFDLDGLTHTLRTKLGSSLDSVASGMPEQQFKFRIYSIYTAAAFFLAYFISILIFLWFSAVPNLLRDPDGPVRETKHVFSLSRCQLAFWFFVILGAWIFLWVTTSSLDTLSETALIVSGIGSGAAVTGIVAGKVRDEIAGGSLSTVTLNVNERPRGFRAGPGAVLYDLLSDRDTVAFHRFQLLVWNLILGGVFLWKTVEDFAMPEFNSTLLGLLGLSAVTFVGIKMTPTADNRDPNPPNQNIAPAPAAPAVPNAGQGG